MEIIVPHGGDEGVLLNIIITSFSVTGVMFSIEPGPLENIQDQESPVKYLAR